MPVEAEDEEIGERGGARGVCARARGVVTRALHARRADRPSTPVIAPPAPARKGRGGDTTSVANEVDADYNEYLHVRARRHSLSPLSLSLSHTPTPLEWRGLTRPACNLVSCQSLAPDGVVGRAVLKRLGEERARARRS